MALLYNLFLVFFLAWGWPLLLVYMYHRQGSLEGLGERLGFGPRDESAAASTRPVTWFHGASVGEIRMLVPLIAAWQRNHPEEEILVTTMTMTGRQTAARVLPAARIRLLPFDLPGIWGRFFRRHRPARLVIAETELWPNLLGAAAKHGLPVALVNARISEKSFRGYRFFAFFTRSMFARLGLVVVQDEESGRRFTALGTPPERVVYCGNMKFDFEFDPLTGEGYAGLFPPESLVLVAGSTHPGEEEMLLAAWEEACRQVPGPAERACLVLAPRHPQRFAEVAAWLREQNCGHLVFSELKKNSSRPRLAELPRVLLLDTLGDLVFFYPLGRAAVIGGTLVPGIGGHNPLEAAVCGRAVIHGPHTASFRDGFRCLDEQGGGLPVADGTELTRLFVRIFREPEWITGKGGEAAATMRRQRGAVACTLEHLKSFFSPSRPPSGEDKV